MKTTIEEQQTIAKGVNGVLGFGKLNWLGNFNHETKKQQFSIFFNKELAAKKAMNDLKNLNPRINKTPKYINTYFKFSITIEQ